VNKKSEDGKLLSAFGFLPVTKEPATLSQGQAVSIIQHPNGRTKAIALRNNNITKVDGDLLMYTTDTLGGSSGSPIFNDAWDVAGLHHSGVPAMDSKGRILSIDGKVWQEWMGDNKVNWIANEGIQMASIVKDIIKRKLTEKQKALLPNLFSKQ
jgi:V8-like Glu-specific endopeptidase